MPSDLTVHIVMQFEKKNFFFASLSTYLPCLEAHRIDNGGLDDLRAREDAPRDGQGPVAVAVGGVFWTLRANEQIVFVKRK